MTLCPGHTEAVQLLYNPAVVSYKELLTVLFDRMDPTTLNRSGHHCVDNYNDMLIILMTL